MRKLLGVLALLNCIPSFAQLASNISAPRAATVTACASNTLKREGCDVQLTGTSDQTLLNSAIANCPGNQTTNFTGTISSASGSTATLTTSAVSGIPLSVNAPFTGTSVPAGTYISSGSSSPWTIGNINGTTLTNVGPEAMIGQNPQPVNPGGCKVIFRAGDYNISNSIIIDRSGITLEGENLPVWGGYSGSAWNGSTAVGLVANQGAHINQIGSGYNIIQVNHTFVPDGTEGRHRGIRITNLYITGSVTTPPYSDNGIFDVITGSSLGGDDNSHFDHLFIHRVNNAIYYSLDNAFIYYNNIQDVSNDAFHDVGSIFSLVQNNKVYDIGGIGFNNSNGGASADITANSFGDCTTAIALGHQSSATNNFIEGVTKAAIEIDGLQTNVVGNYINFGLGSFSTKTRTKPAIWFCNGCETGTPGGTITGNTLIGCNGGNCGGSQEASGIYAIDTTNASSNSVVQDNNILPGWNNNTQPFINNPSSTANVTLNNGDSSATKYNGVPYLNGYRGTTGSIGGSALLAGQCSAGTATVTGATTSMVASASPSSDPDSSLSTGIAIYPFVSSANTVTVRVCAIVAVTPAAATYNVLVVQ